MRKICSSFCVLILFFALPNIVLAQGDECGTASVLTAVGVCNAGSATSGTSVGATESLAPCGSSIGALDVWYRFTATSSSYTVEVEGQGGFDPVFELMTGTCPGSLGAKQSISCGSGCIDNSGNNGTETETYYGFEIGSTVYIRVYGWYFLTPSTGNFRICLIDECSGGTPANDICAGADVLTISTAISTSTNCASPTAAEDPAIGDLCAGTIENSVWYTFTPVTSGLFDVTFANYSCSAGSGLQMGVLTGSCPGPWTSIVCQSADPPGTMSFVGSAGTTYTIAIDGTCGSQCDFDLEISSACPITNDDCANSTDITGITGIDTQVCLNGECNSGADDDITFAGTCGDPSGAVVWYQFTTDAADGLVDITINSTDFSPMIQTFNDCAAGANTFDYCNVTSGATATLTSIPVSGSTTYYFTVSPNAGVGNGDFDVCITSYPNTCTPSDDCPGTGPTVFGPLSSAVQSCLNNECNVGSTNPFTPRYYSLWNGSRRINMVRIYYG
jgi:trimeric autotransporter adhesin